MNQDMYGATGKLGNRTYYQRRGKTIARIITTPKNPKTDGQTLQRILQKAVNKTYSKLKTICNHTFEGYEDGFDCMNRFKTINHIQREYLKFSNKKKDKANKIVHTLKAYDCIVMQDEQIVNWHKGWFGKQV